MPNTQLNILPTTGIFYRDEDGNCYCSTCAEEAREYGPLEWEISDKDNPIECNGCPTIIQ